MKTVPTTAVVGAPEMRASPGFAFPRWGLLALRSRGSSRQRFAAGLILVLRGHPNVVFDFLKAFLN